MGLPRVLRGVGLRCSDFWGHPEALPLAGISMPLLVTAFLLDANVRGLPRHKSFLHMRDESVMTSCGVSHTAMLITQSRNPFSCLRAMGLSLSGRALRSPMSWSRTRLHDTFGVQDSAPGDWGQGSILPRSFSSICEGCEYMFTFSCRRPLVHTGRPPFCSSCEAV